MLSKFLHLNQKIQHINLIFHAVIYKYSYWLILIRIPIIFDETMARADSDFKLEIQKIKKEHSLEVKNSEQMRNQLKANNNLIEIKQSQVKYLNTLFKLNG